MKVAVHSFSESLAKSHAQADACWWYDVYRHAFPNLQAAVCVRDDGWAQRGGIDRVLVLASGRTLWVDEKVRSEDWPDILLEYWSDYERRVPGWVEKELACDFIAYAFVPSQTCYLFPFQTLRAAWRANADHWAESYRVVEARNRGYTSISVAVPTNVLMASLSDAMRVTWGTGQRRLRLSTGEKPLVPSGACDASGGRCPRNLTSDKICRRGEREVGRGTGRAPSPLGD